jgi:hypothetical protein
MKRLNLRGLPSPRPRILDGLHRLGQQAVRGGDAGGNIQLDARRQLSALKESSDLGGTIAEAAGENAGGR